MVDLSDLAKGNQMQFQVTVSYTKRYKKTLTIYANDEGQAEEKAVDIVSAWDDVEDAEVSDIS